MKKLLTAILIMVSVGVIASRTDNVSAHAGGPPYTVINGIYAQINPILN